MNSPPARLTVMVITLASMLLAACASPRASLGPTDSPCFHALPPAVAAVGHQGRFAGLTLTDVPARFGAPRPRPRRERFPTTTLPPSPTVPGEPATTLPKRDVCLVAFRGTFDVTKMALLRGPDRTGHYAIVVVGVRSHRAIFVYLTESLASGFRHL